MIVDPVYGISIDGPLNKIRPLRQPSISILAITIEDWSGGIPSYWIGGVP